MIAAAAGSQLSFLPSAWATDSVFARRGTSTNRIALRLKDSPQLHLQLNPAQVARPVSAVFCDPRKVFFVATFVGVATIASFPWDALLLVVPYVSPPRRPLNNDPSLKVSFVFSARPTDCTFAKPENLAK